MRTTSDEEISSIGSATLSIEKLLGTYSEIVLWELIPLPPDEVAFCFSQKFSEKGVYTKVNRKEQNKVGHSRKSKQRQVAPKGATMTSQLHPYFQASQAVHGADDITTPCF